MGKSEKNNIHLKDLPNLFSFSYICYPTHMQDRRDTHVPGNTNLSKSLHFN